MSADPDLTSSVPRESGRIPAAPAEQAGRLPALHPRPARGWINDPNGVCRVDGRCHVFFQHNPHSSRHDAIHWGHLSSPDLLRWVEHPTALTPQPDGPDAAGCWSGVVAIDDDGTPVAIYSGITDHSGASSVVLARGSADLTRWDQAGTTATGMPTTVTVSDARDPFVFRFAGRRWAIQGGGVKTGDPTVVVYDAAHLDDWRELGPLLDADDPVARDAAANIWECPQLVRPPGADPDEWVLILSLWRTVGEEAVLSGVGHLVGRLDLVDERPRFTSASAGVTDTGPQFYAPQALADGGRVLLWGWSPEPAEEDDARDDTTPRPWTGLLTLPRQLRLSGHRLVVEPAVELTGLRSDALDLPAGTRWDLPETAEVIVPADAGETVLGVLSKHGEREVARLDAGEGLRMLLDRGIAEVYRTNDVAHTVRTRPGADETWVVRTSRPVELPGWHLTPPA